MVSRCRRLWDHSATPLGFKLGKTESWKWLYVRDLCVFKAFHSTASDTGYILRISRHRGASLATRLLFDFKLKSM